jgi:organic hydroperoxide reductase OsmC/OhrA
MSAYTAKVEWRRADAKFTDNKYPRAHTWTFDGGAVVPGSSSPHSVPLPYSDPAAVDPEEALVAAVSSCHMLFFLGGAAARGWLIDSYVDSAEGLMAQNAAGKMAITRITLRPRLTLGDNPGGEQPSAAKIAALHRWAHQECYIANSIKAEVVVEPQTGSAS